MKTLQKLITFIVAAFMIVAMIPAAPVNAEDDYTITLKPGDGTGADIIITNGSGIDDYLIDEEEGIYIFGYACPTCPDSFQAPFGLSFLGWSVGGQTYHTGDIVPLDGVYTLELTALWGSSGDTTLRSLTVQGGTLEPDFSPDVYYYNAKVFSDGPQTITVHGEPTDSNAIVRYNGKEICEPSWSIDVDVINGTSVSKYVVRIDVVSTVSVTVEGQGTARVGNLFSGEETTIIKENSLYSLVASPEKGWKLKEWQLISGEGSVNNQYGTFRAGSTNAVLKAIFERSPYTVTFNPDGGSVDTAFMTTGADGKLVSLPTPTKNGMKFKGWYTSGGDKVTIDMIYDDDTEIFARWYKDSSASLELPGIIDLTPNDEWTAFPVRVTELDLQENANDRKPDRMRVVFTGGTLVNQDDPSRTIPFKLDNYNTDTRTPRNQRMTDAKAASDQQLYIYVSVQDWEGAMPGTYTGTIDYVANWMYVNPVFLDSFENGTITVNVTIVPPGTAAPPAEGSAQEVGPGSGTGSDTVTQSDTPMSPNNAPAVPKTGDANVAWIWGAIMTAALVAALGLICKVRRRPTGK